MKRLLLITLILGFSYPLAIVVNFLNPEESTQLSTIDSENRYGDTVAFGRSGFTAKDYFERAKKKEGEKDYKGAIADNTKAIEINSQYVDAYFNRARIKYAFLKFKLPATLCFELLQI